MWLPSEHFVRVSTRLAASPDEVWSVITDFEHAPEWRDGVGSVRVGAGPEGRLRIEETDRSGGVLVFDVSEQTAPHRLAVDIVQSSGFRGGWTYRGR
jgi:uncharacterized protein YndB with AHSA1/START domain